MSEKIECLFELLFGDLCELLGLTSSKPFFLAWTFCQVKHVLSIVWWLFDLSISLSQFAMF